MFLGCTRSSSLLLIAEDASAPQGWWWGWGYHTGEILPSWGACVVFSRNYSVRGVMLSEFQMHSGSGLMTVT